MAVENFRRDRGAANRQEHDSRSFVTKVEFLHFHPGGDVTHSVAPTHLPAACASVDGETGFLPLCARWGGKWDTSSGQFSSIFGGHYQ